MRIKGWKKVFESEGGRTWKGKDGDRVIIAYVKTRIPSKWIMGANGMLHIEKAKSESQALKYAISYMRRHPNG